MEKMQRQAEMTCPAPFRERATDCYGYLTLLSRYGQSITITTGTGMAPPKTVDGTLY